MHLQDGLISKTPQDNNDLVSPPSSLYYPWILSFQRDLEVDLVELINRYLIGGSLDGSVGKVSSLQA